MIASPARELCRNYPGLPDLLNFRPCERTTRHGVPGEPVQVSVESDRAPVSHGARRQMHDAAPEHATADRGDAFAAFQVNVERHSRQEPMWRVDKQSASGRIDDRHDDAATNASRVDAMFPNRSSTLRLASLDDGWCQRGFQRPDLQSKR